METTENTYKFLLLLGTVFIHKDHGSFEDCKGETGGAVMAGRAQATLLDCANSQQRCYS